MQINDHIARFKGFIESNGNSPNVCAMYYKRVRTFLGARPEAMTADEAELRAIVDRYIESLPVTSGIGVTATAVRYYWTMRFGKPYFRRFELEDYPVNFAIECECLELEEHLMGLGRLKDTTIRQRVRKVRQFLYTMFGYTEFDRGMVDLASVTAYLSEELAHASAATKMGFRTEIRSYASFLCTVGCEATAGPITLVSLTGPQCSDSLPKRLPDKDYTAMADGINAATPRGKRDLAMLLLMGNLGLRRSDVAWLTLDDIDWANGILHITNSKSISDRSLPLDAVTGKAVEDYVLNGRSSETDSRMLFLPCGKEKGSEGLKPRQVGSAISLLSEKAGVRSVGTHALRHAVASDMIANGVPIKPIADILGHESLETTMGYLRVDVEMLRKAAAPWPGEVER